MTARAVVIRDGSDQTSSRGRVPCALRDVLPDLRAACRNVGCTLGPVPTGVCLSRCSTAIVTPVRRRGPQASSSCSRMPSNGRVRRFLRCSSSATACGRRGDCSHSVLRAARSAVVQCGVVAPPGGCRVVAVVGGGAHVVLVLEAGADGATDRGQRGDDPREHRVVGRADRPTHVLGQHRRVDEGVAGRLLPQVVRCCALPIGQPQPGTDADFGGPRRVRCRFAGSVGPARCVRGLRSGPGWATPGLGLDRIDRPARVQDR